MIDTGRVKETSYDPESGLSRLTEIWVTQAAARQRRGRAGRTGPGECFKLYTRKQEEDMGRFPVPEILRVPLESLSLAVKAVREDEDVKVSPGRVALLHLGLRTDDILLLRRKKSYFSERPSILRQSQPWRRRGLCCRN